MYENNDRGGQVPGQNEAVVSLVLGIIAVVLWFFGYSSIVSVVLGVVGLVYASKAKQLGFNGGMHRLRRRYRRAQRLFLLLTRPHLPASV